ncbi:MAG: hypothetical protein V4726_00855 [Verrucomicrobiota bacterium]
MSTTVIKGPAQIEWAGLKFITKDDINVTINPEGFDVATDAHGLLEERMKSRSVTVAFTPSGQWLGEALTLLSAASGRVPGTSVLSGALVIKPFIAPQMVTTVARAGPTTLPDLNLSASKTLFGGLTFTGIAAVDSATGAIITQTVHAAPVSTFDAPLILTEPWTGNYGVPDGEGDFNPDADVTLLGIETEDGWTIKSEITTDMCRADSVGIVDILQTSFKVTASCRPVGVAEDAMAEFLQRGGASDIALRPGMSFAYDGAGLYLTSRSGYKVALTKCGIRSGSMMWGSTKNRTDGLTFSCIRKFASGAMQPLLTFTVPG